MFSDTEMVHAQYSIVHVRNFCTARKFIGILLLNVECCPEQVLNFMTMNSSKQRNNSRWLNVHCQAYNYNKYMCSVIKMHAKVNAVGNITQFAIK